MKLGMIIWIICMLAIIGAIFYGAFVIMKKIFWNYSSTFRYWWLMWDMKDRRYAEFTYAQIRNNKPWVYFGENRCIFIFKIGEKYCTIDIANDKSTMAYVYDNIHRLKHDSNRWRNIICWPNTSISETANMNTNGMKAYEIILLKRRQELIANGLSDNTPKNLNWYLDSKRSVTKEDILKDDIRNL